jgi:hypothetical protein
MKVKGLCLFTFISFVVGDALQHPFLHPSFYKHDKELLHGRYLHITDLHVSLNKNKV